jgi:hypothetical protein
MRSELASAQAGRREASEEAGEGSRVSQFRDFPAQGGRSVETDLIGVDGFRRVELRGVVAVFAPGAVAAGVGEVLSKVGGEVGGLAAVVGTSGRSGRSSYSA